MREMLRKDHSDHPAETRPWEEARAGGRRAQGCWWRWKKVKSGGWTWKLTEDRWTCHPGDREGARLSPKLLTKQTGGWWRC